MKLLLDACIGKLVCQGLRLLGHDVSWVGEWAADPGDAVILARAVEEERVVITLDKDIGFLMVHTVAPSSGIIRLSGISLAIQAHAVDDIGGITPQNSPQVPW